LQKLRTIGKRTDSDGFIWNLIKEEKACRKNLRLKNQQSQKKLTAKIKKRDVYHFTSVNKMEFIKGK
jgi:hypothetical protein